jgi:hypothetical protein
MNAVKLLDAEKALFLRALPALILIPSERKSHAKH